MTDETPDPLGSGRLPANVALLHILMNAASRADAEAQMELAHAQAGPGEAQRIAAMRELSRTHPGAFDLVRGVLAIVDHGRSDRTPEQVMVALGEAFDRAATLSPDASSALYALGDPQLLAAATAEVLNAMRRWGLLERSRRALEVGCGSGRFLQALSPELDFVVGTEISASMAEAAQSSVADLANVGVVRCVGNDLSFIPDQSIDLILYADSFPYLVQAGGEFAARHVQEAARVLKRSGHLLILNVSYRSDPQQDRADIARWGRAAGFQTVTEKIGEFELWDAVSFLLSA